HVVGQVGPAQRDVLLKTGEDVLQRAADHEVFLQEPKRASGLGRVVWVEHARNRFGRDVANHSPDEIAVRELCKVEGFGRSGGPEPERVDTTCSIADYRPIVGDSEDR